MKTGTLDWRYFGGAMGQGKSSRNFNGLSLGSWKAEEIMWEFMVPGASNLELKS
jgi:hypothetical protein